MTRGSFNDPLLALICWGCLTFPTCALSQESAPVTTVSGVTVQGGGVPIPAVGPGAPVYSQQEFIDLSRTARFDLSYFENDLTYLVGCYIDLYGFTPNTQRTMGYDAAIPAARKLASAVTIAENASLAAQQARLDAAEGLVTMDKVIETELARQEAVLAMRKAQADLDEAKATAIDVQDLVRNRVPIGAWTGVVADREIPARARVAVDPWALVPEEFRDLRLRDIRAVEFFDENGEPFIQVQGAIENTRNRRISIPPLEVMALDPLGYTLLTKTASVRGQIPAGESKAFSYDLKPSPIRTARVTVTFAGIQATSYLEPASTDPTCQGEARPELDPLQGTIDTRLQIRNTRFNNDNIMMRQLEEQRLAEDQQPGDP